MLETHDGAAIYMQTTGVRKGSKAVLDALGDDASIGPDQYSMRLSVTMETGDERVSAAIPSLTVDTGARTDAALLPSCALPTSRRSTPG